MIDGMRDSTQFRITRFRILSATMLHEVCIPMGFILAILVANYAMALVPNIKFFDLIVFVAGYTLGFRRGVTVAMGAWLIYGTFNPWGVAGPFLLVSLMITETVYAFAGAGLRRVISQEQLRITSLSHSLLFAVAAMACTITYDVLTNIYTGVVWAQMSGGIEYSKWIVTALFNPAALIFYAMHIGSNIFFFALFGPVIAKGIGKGNAVLRCGL